MEKILLFIKHKLTFLWIGIEKINGILFGILYRKRLNRSASFLLSKPYHPDFQFRILGIEDVAGLNDFLGHMDKENLAYFNPHPFDKGYLFKLQRNPAFLMLGVYEGNEMIGYFFLRFFINRSCFVGRIIASSHQGRGIGKIMNTLMYETAWSMGFRCQATISKHNHSVQRAHKKNSHMVIRKQLKNDFLLVEFLPDSKSKN